MDIKFIGSSETFLAKDIVAFQVVSLEDPYHPRDIGFFSSYDKALEMAEEYESMSHTTMYGGMGIKIYEIRIQG